MIMEEEEEIPERALAGTDRLLIRAPRELNLPLCCMFATSTSVSVQQPPLLERTILNFPRLAANDIQVHMYVHA